ncbi:MAG: polyprenyl synthetase family protein [Bdellovibrionales bacterium]|nr:polyprenyl synthetase family protein [Bdellovibrionales bacterium]
MHLEQELKHFEAFIEEKTHAYFPLPSLLNEAIHYSLLSEGKRIRPLLCLGFAHAFKGNQAQAMSSGMAIEMIHTYSLIHDDLPAMDNDDLRRGRPTNHIVFGEAQAILAGDSLLTMAPEFLMRELTALPVKPEKIVELVVLLLQASGHNGMALGQSLDMEFEKKDLSQLDRKSLESSLANIHKLKTGAIISWSCMAGLYSHPDQNIIQKYKCQVQSIGQRIGLLFQMVDDVLDVTASLSGLGKTPGKDERSGKLTYTNLYGLKDATAMARALAKELHLDLRELNSVEGDWSMITEIINSLEKRLPIS